MNLSEILVPRYYSTIECFYNFDAPFMEQLVATVIKSTGSWYSLKKEDGELLDARIKGKFRIKGIRTTNPIAVGDKVVYEEQEDGNAVITDILDRKNYIIRKSVNLSKESHIIASNLDQAVLIITLANPTTSLGFIDRFLITCEAYHIPAKLVFNKVDLLDGEDLSLMKEMIERYTGIGYDCFQTSASEGTGLESFKDLLKNQISLLSGHSGVGKSSLVNRVDGSLELRVGEISESHYKGKHTTTFAEMFELDFGGSIIDSPGIKGFGLVHFEKEELAGYFPELRALLPECKFHNCVHVKEPKCAVKEAVENGEVSEERYDSYLALYLEENDENYRTSIYS